MRGTGQLRCRRVSPGRAWAPVFLRAGLAHRPGGVWGGEGDQGASDGRKGATRIFLKAVMECSSQRDGGEKVRAMVSGFQKERGELQPQALGAAGPGLRRPGWAQLPCLSPVLAVPLRGGGPGEDLHAPGSPTAPSPRRLLGPRAPSLREPLSRGLAGA